MKRSGLGVRAERHSQEYARGLNELEGYLLAQAEATDALSCGEAFAAQMPWLTTAQREEVVRLYATDRLQISRAALQRVTDRVLELQCQYSSRYHALQVRLLGLFLSALAVFVVVLMILVY
ncbi:hypothetical protein QFZ66_001824 [Streptomyces sp. B4I13]|uniref:hypothetical protein n=1 Tax=Streptomyces TaxID=1883 RepID=UPI0027877C47|nr:MULTISPECIES: hypothetical protein [Streptomyces]MDQ0834468.1 hypothetical protein [Streptomyces achromogenes]MDQ0957946.1 hypothetical protein [Streptomyces sp. B4I13]